MRRLCVLLVAIMLIVPTFIFADEIELGIAVTPLGLNKNTQADQMGGMLGSGDGFFQNNSLGLHAGYSLAWLFYASIDANIMPSWWIKTATEMSDPTTGEFKQGILAPGYMTFIDVGIRPTLGPIILMAELGMNYLYIHDTYNKDPLTGGPMAGGSIGANLRIGVGYKFSAFSVSLQGTAVFPNFEALSATLKGVANEDQKSIDALKASLIPSLTFYLHL